MSPSGNGLTDMCIGNNSAAFGADSVLSFKSKDTLRHAVNTETIFNFVSDTLSAAITGGIS